VSQSKVGSSINLKVIRNKKRLKVKVRIDEFPQEVAKSAPSEPAERYSSTENTLAGFSVMALTRDIAKQLDLSRNEKGVVIVSVKPYSAAEEGGLKKGDVIQEINKKKVGDLDDFNKMTKRLREGDTVLLFINRSGNKFYVTLKIYS
jgi:serine protease Do